MRLSKLVTMLSLCCMMLSAPAYTMDGEENTHQLSSHVKLTLPPFQQDTPWNVTLESDRLFMRSIHDKEDEKYYSKIFADTITMHKYMDGKIKTPDDIRNRHARYWDCWKSRNPFSSYLIFLKKEAAEHFLASVEAQKVLVADVSSDTTHHDINKPQILLADLQRQLAETNQLYIGHILLEPMDVLACDADELMKKSEISQATLEKSVELSYVLHHFFWRHGYGTEALRNVIEASRFFHKKGFTLNSHPVENLIATASKNNEGSWTILEKNNFSLKASGEVKGYNGERRLYLLNVKSEGTPSL